MNDFWKHIKSLPKAQGGNGSWMVGTSKYQGEVIPEYSGSWDEAFKKAREDWGLHRSTTILWNGKPMNIEKASEIGTWSSTSDDPKNYPYVQGLSREEMAANPEYAAYVEEYRAASPTRQKEMDAERIRADELKKASDLAQTAMQNQQNVLKENYNTWNTGAMLDDARPPVDNTNPSSFGTYPYLDPITGKSNYYKQYDSQYDEENMPDTNLVQHGLNMNVANEAAYNMIFGDDAGVYRGGTDDAFKYNFYDNYMMQDEGVDLSHKRDKSKNDEGHLSGIPAHAMEPGYKDAYGHSNEFAMNLGMFGQQNLIPEVYRQAMQENLSEDAYSDWYNQIQDQGVEDYKKFVRESAINQASNEEDYFLSGDKDLKAKTDKWNAYENMPWYNKAMEKTRYFAQHPFSQTVAQFTDPFINLATGQNIGPEDYMRDDIMGTNTVEKSSPFRTFNQVGFGRNSAFDMFAGSIPYHMAQSAVDLPGGIKDIATGDDVGGGWGKVGWFGANVLPFTKPLKNLKKGYNLLKGVNSSQVKNAAYAIGDMSLTAPAGYTQNLLNTGRTYGSSLFRGQPNVSNFNATNLNILKDLKALPAGLSESTLAKYPNLYNTVMRQGVKNANTSYRSVYPKGEGLGMQKGWDMAKTLGFSMEDDIARGQYMATHVPGKSYGYRSGFDHISAGPYDALFTSAKPSSGMYGNQTWRVRPKGLGLDVQSGSIDDIMKKYVTNRPIHGSENIPAYGNIYGSTGYKPILKFLEGTKNAPSGLHTIGDLGRPQTYVGMRGKQLLETVGKPLDFGVTGATPYQKYMLKGNFRPGGEAPYIPYDLPQAQYGWFGRQFAKGVERISPYVDDAVKVSKDQIKKIIPKITKGSITPTSSTIPVRPLPGSPSATGITDPVVSYSQQALNFVAKPFKGLGDELVKLPTNIKNVTKKVAIPVQYTTPTSTMSTLEQSLVNKVSWIGKNVKENEQVLKLGYGQNEKSALSFLTKLEQDMAMLSDDQFVRLVGWRKELVPKKIKELTLRVNSKKGTTTIGDILGDTGHVDLRRAVGEQEYSQIIARDLQAQANYQVPILDQIAALEIQVAARTAPVADLNALRNSESALADVFRRHNLTLPSPTVSTSVSGQSVAQVNDDIIRGFENLTATERATELANHPHITRNIREVDDILANHYQILPDGRRVRSNSFASSAEAQESLRSLGVTTEQFSTYGLDATDVSYIQARMNGLQRPASTTTTAGSASQSAYSQGFSPSGNASGPSQIANMRQSRIDNIVRNDIQGPQLNNIMQTYGITEGMVTDAYSAAGRIRPRGGSQSIGSNIGSYVHQPSTPSPKDIAYQIADENRQLGTASFKENMRLLAGHDYDLARFIPNKPKWEGLLSAPVKKFNTMMEGVPALRYTKDFQKAKVNPKTEELVGSMFAGQGLNSTSVILAAVRRILNSPKGSSFTASTSLSDDSWALNKLAGTMNKKGQVDLKFSGFLTSNEMNFSHNILPKELRIKEMNRIIFDLNSNLPIGKKIPYAYIEPTTSSLKMPGIDVIRKTLGGETVPESEAYDTYDLNDRNIFTPYDEAPLNVNDMDLEDALGVYRKYIEGGYDGSDNEKTAEKVYEMLNQKYYNAAKQKGMSVANYVMTNIRG